MFEEEVKKMNKSGEYKDNLEIQEVVDIQEIPGVNAPRLQSEISVSGNSAEILNLQSQIDSLDARVTALENA